MSEAAPAPAPAAEAPKAGVNADPTQFNIKQAMDEWANLPAEEAKADAAKQVKDAKDAKAEDIAADYDGAQSSLVFDKEGNVQSEKSKVARVDKNGHIIHLDKRKVNKAADQIAELRDYQGDNLVTPNQAVPALRDKRIEAIKAELTTIAGRSGATTKNGERELTSGPHARQLRAELHDLTSRKASEAARTPKPRTQTPDGTPAGGTDTSAKPDGWKNLDDLVGGNGDLSQTDANQLLDSVSKKVTNDDKNGFNPEYDGPVKPGMELVAWKKGELVPVNETLADIMSKLNASREAYVKMTAKRRGVSVGGSEDLDNARTDYLKTRNTAGEIAAAELIKAGASEEAVEAFGRAGRIEESKVLAEMIQATQESKEASKSALVRKFNDFWARNTGRKENGKRNWKGMAKKAAVMAAITAVPGLGIGLAATSALALVGAGGAGGLIGGALASSVGRSLFRSKVNHAGEMRTGASVYAEDLIARNEAGLNDKNISAESVTDLVDAQTKELVSKNRKRHIGAFAVGAAGAVGGYYGSRLVAKAAKGTAGFVKESYDNVRGNGYKIGGLGQQPSGPNGSVDDILDRPGTDPTGRVPRASGDSSTGDRIPRASDNTDITGGNTPNTSDTTGTTGSRIPRASEGTNIGETNPEAQSPTSGNPNELSPDVISKAQLDVNNGEYTWTIAHDLTPGRETPTMQAAIDQYNKLAGRRFELKTDTDGILKVMEGGHIVDEDEMRYLDQIMVNQHSIDAAA